MVHQLSMVLSVCASMIRFAGNRACSKLVVLVLVLVFGTSAGVGAAAG